MTDPYDDYADTYRAAGWVGVLPLPPQRKASPPTGYTGEHGQWPTTQDIDTWRKSNEQNIAVRMPPNVIGLDLDTYNGKRGLETFLGLVGRLGHPGPTWETTSRDGTADTLSAIRWYRLPPGQTSHAMRDPGGDIEIIRYGHRYAVAPPSIHPDGRTYTWRTPDGHTTDSIPTAADLAELPAAWCDELNGTTAAPPPGDVWDLTTRVPHADRFTEPITEKRDDTLAAYTASCAARGLSQAETFALLDVRKKYVVGGDPAWPFTVDDYKRWWKGALKFAPGDDVEAQIDAPGVIASRIDWHALLGDDMPAEEWILDPLLAVGRQIVIYSPPKVGKSLLALELAAGVASGRPVIGSGPIAARTVLYLDYENAPADIRERALEMDLHPEDLDRLVYLSFPPLPKLDTAPGGSELLALAQEVGAELVIVDTATRTINGEENSNDTWSAWYAHTGLKLKRAGIALIRLDHTGKDEFRGQRGGSSKASDVDAVWRLARQEGDVLHLQNEMSRVALDEKLLVLHRLDEPLRHSVDATGIRGSLTSREQFMVDFMVRNGIPATLSVRETRTACAALGQSVGQKVAIRAQEHRLGVVNGD